MVVGLIQSWKNDVNFKSYINWIIHLSICNLLFQSDITIFCQLIITIWLYCFFYALYEQGWFILLEVNNLFKMFWDIIRWTNLSFFMYKNRINNIRIVCFWIRILVFILQIVLVGSPLKQFYTTIMCNGEWWYTFNRWLIHLKCSNNYFYYYWIDPKHYKFDWYKFVHWK